MGRAPGGEWRLYAVRGAHDGLGTRAVQLSELETDWHVGKGRKAPRFAHHSWRRLADTTADECLAAGLCTSEDIELHFGWRLKEYKKLMRLHYADRGKRTARAKIVKGM